jgi:hypothetical protein
MTPMQDWTGLHLNVYGLDMLELGSRVARRLHGENGGGPRCQAAWLRREQAQGRHLDVPIEAANRFAGPLRGWLTINLHG